MLQLNYYIKLEIIRIYGNISSTTYTNLNLDISLYNNPCPSREEAQKTFLGLGKNSWKQVIDGEYHKYGPFVFDEALHKRKSEPGFYDSLQKGLSFTSERITNPLTISFYKKLHKVVCSHFKGKENNTLMKAEEAGKFRNPKFTELGNPIVPTLKTPIPTNNLTQYEENRCLITQELSKNCNDLNVSIFAEFIINHDIVTNPGFEYLFAIIYSIYSAKELKKICKSLFDHYNTKIEELNSKIKASSNSSIHELLFEKIKIIAWLFQMLEWLHPFEDGQGRTDLILLGKLLSQEGLNPPILNAPYMSSIHPLEDWVEYLLEGIEKWRIERDQEPPSGQRRNPGIEVEFFT